MKTTQDIFVSDKADFYELAPGTKVTMQGGLRESQAAPAATRQTPADMSDLNSEAPE